MIALRHLIKEYIGGGWGKEAPDQEHVVPAYVIRGTDLEAVQSGTIGSVPARWHKASNARSRTLLPGDIIFEVSGGSKEQPVGRSLLLDTNRLGQFQSAVIPASFCKKIRPDSNKVNSRFLLAHLQLAWSDRRIVQWQVQSTGISNFNFEAFLDDFLLDLPPLPIQRRIAGILSAYDELIENNQRRIKILEQIARSLYREWFVHFRYPGHENVPLVPSPLGEIPQGWEVCELGDFAQFKSGFAFKSGAFTADGEHRLVTIKNVQDGAFNPESDSRISDLPTNLPPYCVLKDGDILLSLTGNVGRVCLVYDGPYLLNQRVSKLSPVAPLDWALAYCIFRQPEMRTKLELLSNGVAQQNLSPVLAAKMEFVLPPHELRQRFQLAAEPMVKSIVQLFTRIQNLRRTRDLLLPRLLSGQIDVEAMPS
jgi:type I restriction enzyme S subunit